MCYFHRANRITAIAATTNESEQINSNIFSLIPAATTLEITTVVVLGHNESNTTTSITSRLRMRFPSCLTDQ
jgi:hypothetical protein